MSITPDCSHLWPERSKGHKWLQKGVIDNNPDKMVVIRIIIKLKVFRSHNIKLKKNICINPVIGMKDDDTIKLTLLCKPPWPNG